MCGIAGYVDMRLRYPPDERVLERMTNALAHRGPDSRGSFIEDYVGLAACRLSIVDLHTGDQPIENADGTIVLCCNGEIFNHAELREKLRAAGHEFRTSSDVEVIVHLYEELGSGLVHKLNGQFSFALYDRRRHRLLLARDHVGITPLHYTVVDGLLVFGSEIKAILAHPRVTRAVDLTGLDQVMLLPGLVSPRTMFQGISSLPPGHLLEVEDGRVRVERYWDLDYPLEAELPTLPGLGLEEHLTRLEEALLRSVELRMRADVPHGYYLSGGLDSSLIAAMSHRLTGGAGRMHTFSVVFPDARLSERPHQRLMAGALGTSHMEVPVTPADLAAELPEAVRHSECPLRESYNVASLRLSRAVRRQGLKVVLTGEGADELFAGYIGYKFDRMRVSRGTPARPVTAEERLRARLWGDSRVSYGRDLIGQADLRRALYSPRVAAELDSFSCLNEPLVDHGKLAGRHILHQRSYLDFKLRLADHLLGDHGDRVALANSVETRYPYLDLEVIECAKAIPPELTLRDFEEKYVLKRLADGYLPGEIVRREKFAFRANASPDLISHAGAWVDSYLNPDRIRKEGYFDDQMVQRLRRRYADRDLDLDLLVEDDLLMIVLTHGILLEVFDLPDLS